MGLFPSRTWFIYGRDENDYWIKEPLASTVAKDDDVEFHMGRFKHYVFKLALGKLDHARKIYLYHGHRVVRAVMRDGNLFVEFSTQESADAWTTCKRSHLGKEFDKYFVHKTSADAEETPSTDTEETPAPLKLRFNCIEDSQFAED